MQKKKMLVCHTLAPCMKMQETQKHHLGWGRTKYRFRGHAEQPFWAWVCSWARSIRRPSDIGGDDSGFVLPPLVETEHVVEVDAARPGMLFSMPGMTLQDERAERRLSINERCDKANELVCQHKGPSVVWCELDAEGDRLQKTIENAVQVSGKMSEDAKEEALTAFSLGQIERLIIKPKIGAWGLNWQHCDNIISFPSHSYEQYYQSIRRCYRFGQKNPVKVHLVVGEGEVGILANLRRKAAQADRMFESIVKHMADAIHLHSEDRFFEKETIPSWL